MSTLNKSKAVLSATKVSETTNINKIIQKLGRERGYILVHPEKHGYSFKVLWGQDYDLEIVGSSSKIHKTKKECIKEVKKLKDFFGNSVFSNLRKAFDHEGNELDIEIKYDIRKLL